MAKEKQKKNPHTEQSSGVIRNLLKRYFVDAVSAMALGLFASLIIGLILSQISKIPYLGFLSSYSDMASSGPVVGAAIGAAIAWGLKAKPLVIFSCVVVGAFGYDAGGPVGAYAATVVGAELARLVAGRTKVDIVLTPLATILPGCIIGQLVGPPVQWFMNMLGGLINTATNTSLFNGAGDLCSSSHGFDCPNQLCGLVYYAGSQRFSCRGCYRGMLCTNDRVCRH